MKFYLSTIYLLLIYYYEETYYNIILISSKFNLIEDNENLSNLITSNTDSGTRLKPRHLKK